MSLLYRYVRYFHHTSDVPVLPHVSFSETIQFTDLATISMDVIQAIWNIHLCLMIAMEYNDRKVYYFILPGHIYYPDSQHHRRIGYYRNMAQDHHCDEYARPVLMKFMERFHRRLHTHTYLDIVRRSIPFPPTELIYHQQFIEKIRIDSLEDRYEFPLLREYYDESMEIVKAHQEYCPEGSKVAEIKQEFEELALLMKTI